MAPAVVVWVSCAVPMHSMERDMKKTIWKTILTMGIILFGTQAWCAGNGSPGKVAFSPDPKDKTYYLLIIDNSPYGLNSLPETSKMMYELGFDEALGPSSADVEIQVFFRGGFVERQDQRVAQGIGGALFGAALGAAIGAATGGSPGQGAAIGAAGGGVVGLAAPVYASQVLDAKFKLRNRKQTGELQTQLDLGGIAPPDLNHYIDEQVAHLLSEIMDK